MKQFLEDFSRTIQEAEKQLLAIPEDVAAAGAPGKWSSKQIIGHLIDSAANNHQRFVLAQTTNDLVCPRYDQEAWVNAQEYNQESWTNLVTLWSAYNRHLAEVIARFPPDRLAAVCRIGEYEPATLAWLAEDYVRHMDHHLAQLWRK